ncbi:MAG: pentapeptide repeat-containing protein [Candidatus Halichondribacter symbioticus]
MFGGRLKFFWINNELAEAVAVIPDNSQRDGMDANNRKDAEGNSWYQFMNKTIKLDGNKHPHGYHWLFSLNRLLGTDVEKIQRRLPDEHPLKSLKIPKWNDAPSINKTASNKIHPLENEIARLVAKNLTDFKKDNKINLSNLKFKNDAYFLNFIFPINVDFTNSTFLQNVYFNGSVFTKTVNFKETVFCGKISKFRDVAFDKIANFRGARFKGYANFKGSIIKGRTTFQETIFESHAPRFYTAKFSNEMTWANIKLPSLLKTDIDSFAKEDDTFNLANRVDSIKADENHSQRIQENQNSYENTSILLKGAEKYHDQHFFFRHEMQCRRWLGGRFNCFIYRLYEWFANYGYGVGHAFGFWIAHMFVWAVILFIWGFKSGCNTYERIACSALTSASNAHSFLFSKGDRLNDCYEMANNKFTFNLFWAGETILGVLFLFLLLLTLRVRFRLK